VIAMVMPSRASALLNILIKNSTLSVLFLSSKVNKITTVHV